MLTEMVLLLTVFLSSSHQQCFTYNDIVSYITPSQSNSWVKSRHNFSISLLKVLNTGRSQQNVVFSPSSIQAVLLLAYFGAEQETEKSLAKILQIPATQRKPLTWHFYNDRRINNIQRHISNFPIKSANKIFLSKKLRLRPCMEEKFGNELELIDYERDSAEWAKSYINNWVDSETEGQIKDLIQDLSPRTPATLVNAVYFKSKWLSQFNPNKTAYLPFHVNPYDRKTTKMMKKEDIFEYGRSGDLGARMLLLPYKGNTTAMIILLPEKNLDTTIESMNVATLAYVTDRRNYKSEYLSVAIPTYELRSNIILNSALARLGIGNTLTKRADFSGFTSKKEVFFDKVVHEAAIKVDEEGTTASAATGMVVSYSAITVNEFFCDRPFVYIIYDFISRKVIFMGTFRDPPK